MNIIIQGYFSAEDIGNIFSRWIRVRRCVENVSKLKLYFQKQRLRRKELLIFFRIVSLVFSQFIIPESFPLVDGPMKLLSWHSISRHHAFLLMSFTSLSLRWMFSLGNKKKLHLLSMEDATPTQSCVSPKTFKQRKGKLHRSDMNPIEKYPVKKKIL